MLRVWRYLEVSSDMTFAALGSPGHHELAGLCSLTRGRLSLKLLEWDGAKLRLTPRLPPRSDPLERSDSAKAAGRGVGVAALGDVAERARAAERERFQFRLHRQGLGPKVAGVLVVRFGVGQLTQYHAFEAARPQHPGLAAHSPRHGSQFPASWSLNK